MNPENASFPPQQHHRQVGVRVDEPGERELPRSVDDGLIRSGRDLLFRYLREDLPFKTGVNRAGAAGDRPDVPQNRSHSFLIRRWLTINYTVGIPSSSLR